MPDKTATPPTTAGTNEDGGKRLMAALAAAGCPPVPKWSNTTRVGRDGYLVAMPKDEKRRAQLAHKQEREEEERDAARDGDHHRAAWARQQASQECGARRPAKQPRARGAGRPGVRGASRRASVRSGDSGSEDGESEPPPAGRRCECGCDLSLVGLRSHARYLNDAHRKRAQRDRDRLQPERVVERSADRAARAKWCQCNGHHVELDPGHCHKCGRDLDDSSTWLDLKGVPARTFVPEFVDETIIRKAAA